METVRAINVPMYTSLRRTAVAFTMIVEYLLTGQKHSLRVFGGCHVKDNLKLIRRSDLIYGYAVVSVANIFTAINLASIARTGNKPEISA
ncbi:hypothetical protein POTOM_024954 [Populus tomentosa]|uniref:Uncharacterized protein n=1 Tax=Populus tomentosa TaxID=118781 RepID=A0A8X8CY03_POPTO|nr:hypothetical protein POTOM_024954 [Populus tomentosa]